ncbi:Aspartic peptidase [Gossypium australe]|uniref:Aspartic peptidase n=1 Tax=Gossypium australe TaxID=47621 RepID=A0A5B6WEL0_9ROSI|nr:Aspartic peptidase [Gossypium australe]
MAKNDVLIQSQAATLKNLENQIGQLATELRNIPQGVLPSDTENPRNTGKEHYKAVALRSVRTLEPKEVEVEDEQAKRKENQPTIGIPAPQMPVSKNFKEIKSKLVNSDKLTPLTNAKSCLIQANVPIPSYPQRLKKRKQKVQFKKFYDVLTQLHINIPLVEALKKMPNYVKFMKDILSKKKRLALTKECSAFLQNKLPSKMNDPESFTIPYNIGESYCGKALCDLRVSINLMPISVFKMLGIGDIRPITMTLQLADRSLAQPKGKSDDVLVRVDKFIFPADFIILDFEADKEVSIILKRPFVMCRKVNSLCEFKNDQVTFNVLKSMKFPDPCNSVEDPLENTLGSKPLEDEKGKENMALMEGNPKSYVQLARFESLELES